MFKRIQKTLKIKEEIGKLGYIKMYNPSGNVFCLWREAGVTIFFLYTYPVDPAPFIEKTIFSYCPIN